MSCLSCVCFSGYLIASITETHPAHSFLSAFKVAARACRARKEKGFYAALNSVSFIDMLPKAEKRERKATRRLWEMERLVAQRESATVS